MTDKQTVAVITSTIGRATLRQAIESVRAQTYPCKHYVFVDGEKYASAAEEILRDYPDVTVTYLPMNTGANGWVNSSINAIAPFLVKADVICYLDDDNTYKPEHVELLMNEMQNGIDFVYSLRDFYHQDGHFICHDDLESLGAYKAKLESPVTIDFCFDGENMESISLNVNGFDRFHIDTNCYAFRHHLALKLAQDWHSGVHNDRQILVGLGRLQSVGRYTGKYTVNYLIDLEATIRLPEVVIERLPTQATRDNFIEILLKKVCDLNIEAYAGKPWCKN